MGFTVIRHALHHAHPITVKIYGRGGPKPGSLEKRKRK